MDELVKVLIEKKTDPESSKMVVECFNDVLTKYGDNSLQAINFLNSLKKVKSIKFVSDIKKDETYSLSSVFGDNLRGINIKDDIIMFCNQKTTLMHEIEHSNQEGFEVPSQYFGSQYLHHMLLEGDAVFHSANLYYEEEKNSIHENSCPYPDQLYFYQSLKLIMGDEFMEKWKHDTSKADYLGEVKNRFKELEGEMFFHKIIGLNFSISYIYEALEKNQGIDQTFIKDIKENEQEMIEMLEKNISTNKNQIKSNEVRMGKMNLDIETYQSYITTPKIISNEEIEEASADLMVAEEQLRKYRLCNGNKGKIRDFIEELAEEYDEEIPYEEMILETINEPKEILDGTVIDKRKNNAKKGIEKLENEISALVKSNSKTELNISKAEYDLTKRKINLETIEFTEKKLAKLDGSLEGLRGALNTLRLELQIMFEYQFSNIKENFDLELYGKVVTSSTFNNYFLSTSEEQKQDAIEKAKMTIQFRMDTLSSLNNNIDNEIKEEIINTTYSKMRFENPYLKEESMTR